MGADVERPVALDDLVTIEVRGLVEEEVVIEEDRVDYRVTADSAVGPMPGFAEQLVGLNRDEEQQFSLIVRRRPRAGELGWQGSAISP